MFEAHGIKVTFVPKKRFLARWRTSDIYPLPEAPQQGTARDRGITRTEMFERT